MKIFFSSILAMLFAATICWAQSEGGMKKTHHAPVVSGTEPVTHAEALATFDRVSGLFKSVLHVTVPPNHKAVNSSTPITKAEVVSEFVRLYKAALPSFTLTPKLMKVEVGRVKADNATEKAELIFLIERSYCGNFGPLATGSSKTLTVEEFGDAVGFFLARISECTHVPSTKWTPYLHGND